MREQVVMPRGGRAGAAAPKSRRVSATQRPAARKGRGSAGDSQGFAWKTALAYAPLAMKLVLAVALGLIAFAGYRTAASASFFKVRSVDVEGASRSSREDIRAAVLRLAASGVWDSDLEVISRELRQLPWVRGAVVTRVMPSGLRVRVTERTPLLIARNGAGRLVWADDEGVMLGAATPGEDDFFVRGLEEAQTEQARRQNRERMALASELKQDWSRTGLSRRVSELNLADLRDVRVQLAGDDSLIEVRLGSQDYARRFRQALEELGGAPRTRNGGCLSYVIMSTGRNAILGYPPCGAQRVAASETPAPESAAPRPTDAQAGATTQPRAAATEARRDAGKPRPAKPEVKPSKRENAAGRGGEATRPRRVG